METMLESEAMAILVGAGVSYGRREAALRAAISATGYDVGSIRKEPWEKKGLFGR